ncbi:hypothetical protein [Pseudomonas sp. 382]|uniref:hypothetical protein n=1 Tax=Pseudomonas sp. 382 TaxID=1751969 RepID=UPI000C193A7C|nr:hypothetical protein [Pseudomonas sp. 382]PIK76387.1 hypothetical protein CQW31_22630 [Pseudomonas sp. 382]
MTVSTTDSVVEYVSGGPAFPIPYRFLQDTDIEAVLVKQDGTSETLTGAQYTLSGAGSQNGGTLTSAYAAGFLGVVGASLTISRVMDPVQPTDLRNQGKFLAETHETVFDRLTMLIQQGFAGISRALKRPIGKNYYDAEGRQIKNLADPTDNQDAVNKLWMQQYVGDVVGGIQGPINNSANVFYQFPDGVPHVVQDLSSPSDASLGGMGVGYKRRTLDKAIVTISDVISGMPCNVWEYAHLCGGYTPGGSPTTWDWRPAIQAALNAWACVYFPPMASPYRVVGEILMNAHNSIATDPSVRIQQILPNTTTFKAILKDNVWLMMNGAMILGEGAWSNTWTGMGGHDDRAIQLWGCTNSGAIRPHVRNCASAGIAIFGGENILIDHPTIEGTHLYGHSIPLLGNFQAGLYIRDSQPDYGICDNLRVPGANISGVAQGVLSELYSAASVISRAHSIQNAIIHDIPGQHAFYMQGGALNVDGAVITNTGLAGVKFQSGDSNAAIRSLSALGITANGIGSNLFEMNCVGSGSVNGPLLSGTVDGCAVGLAINGTIRDLKCDLVATNVTSNAVLIQGDGAKDLDIDVIAQTVGDEGIVMTATNASGVRIRPTLRECNQNNGAGKAAILHQTASGHMIIQDPAISDATTRMDWGIFNSTLGGTIRVRGSVNIAGARDTAVRAIGKIVEWPQESNLSGTNGDFTGLANVTSSSPMRTKATSTSASNVVLWQRSLTAGKTVMIKAKVTGGNAAGTERRSVELFACAYLNAGVATLQGAVTTIANAASAGFGGGLVLQPSGADMILLVNSGGSVAYNWSATVEVTEA